MLTLASIVRTDSTLLLLRRDAMLSNVVHSAGKSYMIVFVTLLITVVTAFDAYPSFKTISPGTISQCTDRFTLESAAHGGVTVWAALCASPGVRVNPQAVDFELEGVVQTGVAETGGYKNLKIDTPGKVAHMRLCATSTVYAQLWASAAVHIC